MERCGRHSRRTRPCRPRSLSIGPVPTRTQDDRQIHSGRSAAQGPRSPRSRTSASAEPSRVRRRALVNSATSSGSGSWAIHSCGSGPRRVIRLVRHSVRGQLPKDRRDQHHQVRFQVREVVAHRTLQPTVPLSPIAIQQGGAVGGDLDRADVAGRLVGSPRYQVAGRQRR